MFCCTLICMVEEKSMLLGTIGDNTITENGLQRKGGLGLKSRCPTIDVKLIRCTMSPTFTGEVEAHAL